MAKVEAAGVEAAADWDNLKSPEAYAGYERAENFASPGGFVRGQVADYKGPNGLRPGQWAYAGRWTVEQQRGRLMAPGGSISIRFKARDLHLVLGSPGNRPIRFRVTVDGSAPAGDHGLDVDATGNGRITDQRLYQLIRHQFGARERTFTITFLDAGAEAYAFTFG